MPTHYYGYLPFGELMVEHNNSNYDNVYKFNGKELDPQTGYYYYGARYYDPTMSVFLSVDPLAEKIPNYNPYIYTFNNPIMFTDPTGMIGEGINPRFSNETAKNEYIRTVEKGTGNTYQVTINEGNVVFTQVSSESVSNEQQAFINEYSMVVNSNIMLNHDVVYDDPSIVVGSFINNTIDMADVTEFDIAGPNGASSAGAFIHETVEQFEKAKMEIPKGSMGSKSVDSEGYTVYPNYNSAHETAIGAENRVNGSIRSDRGRVSSFTKADGTVTRQAIVQQPNGSIKVMKD